jgi:hypothetical protein
MAKDEMFAEAAREWDLEQLYQKLAEAKREVSPRARKGLTEREKLYLRGLLCGYSPGEMAKKLVQSPKGVEVYVCKTLYQYFKKLADVPHDTKVGNWRNINNWLEEAGYKTQSFVQSKSRYSSLTEPLVKIVNIGFVQNNHNAVTLDINIRVVLPSASELAEEEDADSGDRAATNRSD